MTRILTDPCEIGVYSNATSGWNTVGLQDVGTTPYTIDTIVKRTGAGSCKFNTGASDINCHAQQGFGGNTGVGLGVGLYARAYCRFAGGLPSSNQPVFRIDNTGGAALFHCRLNTDGSVSLMYGTAGAPTLVGSSAAGLIVADNGIWYRIELYGITNTGAVDACELRVDGVTISSASGLTVSDSICDMVHFGYMEPLTGAGTNKIMYVDDLAVNISGGTAQNNFPGPGSIVAHYPVSDISRVGWTGGAGGTTNLFDAVNNSRSPLGLAVASATDLSQIKDLANNTTDAYQCEVQDYLTAGVPPVVTITLIQGYAEVSASTSSNMSYTNQIVSNPAGSARTMTMNAAATAGTWPSGWAGTWTDAIISPSVALGTRPQISVTKGTASATISQTVDLILLLTEFNTASAADTPVIWSGRGAA